MNKLRSKVVNSSSMIRWGRNNINISISIRL